MTLSNPIISANAGTQIKGHILVRSAQTLFG